MANITMKEKIRKQTKEDNRKKSKEIKERLFGLKQISENLGPN